MSVTAVIPSRNRSLQVTRKVSGLLSDGDVDQIVVIADGCTDDTVERLRDIHDDRLAVIVNAESMGPPQARMAGARAATSDWLLMLDDDDAHADGFLQTLLAVAREHDADAVGSPWLAPDRREISERVRQRRAEPCEPSLDHYDRFPSRDIECPWLNNNYLIRRELLTSADYGNDAFPYNYFREESDLFLGLWAAGKRLILTPKTYSWMPVQVGGGVNKTSRARYEYWVLRNHWTFLERRYEPLKDLGAVRAPIPLAWAAYAARRIWLLARLWTAARWSSS